MSRRPMNIQRKWMKLVDKISLSWYNEDKNIEAGVVLIKRISKSVFQPTAEKIATLWNSLGKDKVSDFGNYVGKRYRKKEWERWEKQFRKKKK